MLTIFPDFMFDFVYFHGKIWKNPIHCCKLYLNRIQHSDGMHICLEFDIRNKSTQLKLSRYMQVQILCARLMLANTVSVSGTVLASGKLIRPSRQT